MPNPTSDSLTVKEAIEQGNKLIAEFDGIKIGVDKYSWHPGCEEPIQVKNLNYHASWGWIMPVAKKILDLTPLNGKAMSHINQMERVVSALMVADMNKIYLACVDFINWYNEQSKPNQP